MRIEPTFQHRRGAFEGRSAYGPAVSRRARVVDLPVGARPVIPRAALGALGVALCGGVALAAVLIAPARTASDAGPDTAPTPNSAVESSSMAPTSTTAAVAVMPLPASTAQAIERRALAGANEAKLAALTTARQASMHVAPGR